MNILALVHRVPYPPNKGEKIRAFQALRHLAARGHAIDLATFADAAEDRAWAPQLREHCREVLIVPRDPRLSRARAVLGLPRQRPLSVGYFASLRLRARVERWLQDRSYDVALCYSAPMAEYVRTPAARAKRMARVMDFVDVDSDKWAQYAAHAQQPMRALYRLEARALAAYERAVAEEFDASTFVSPAEAALFRTLAPAARRVVDIPNGVDAAYFGATLRRPPPAARPVVVFVGQMDYLANVDAVRWFATEALPPLRAALPGLELRIVGRAPAPEVRRLGERPGVRVTGAVDDVRAHLAEATLMIAPLRIARGVQNKVLEGMAARLPVVVSPPALEGIDAEAGRHLLVAGDAEGFVAAVRALIAEPGLASALAEAARARVVERYAWEPAMERMESLLRTVASCPSPPAAGGGSLRA